MGRPHKKVVEKQANVLIEIDQLLKKELKRKKEILWDTTGYKIDNDGNVIELNLNFKELKTLPESLGDLSSLEKLFLYKNEFTLLPNSIGNLKSLQMLHIGENKLKSLPDSIGNLNSLQELQCPYNRLTILPSSIGKLKSLVELNFEHNRLQELPESLGDLKSIKHIDLSHNQLANIPDSIGRVKTLEVLDLEHNRLTWLPESIGNLKKLEKLDLSDNKLKMLPGFIDNLKSLTTLDIRRNDLATLPGYLWRLQYLDDLRIAGNPLIDEWKKLKGKSTEAILEFCRQSGSVNVFFSYSLSDYQSAKYPIDEIANYMKDKEYISYIYHCSQDMAKKGQIDKFMDEVIPHCQFVVFMATKNSLSSDACIHELSVTSTHNIKIIPILFDVNWENSVLQRMGLTREFGLKYEGDARKLATDLYNYILQYKREYNVFTLQEAETRRNVLNIKRTIVNFIESDEFEALLQKSEAEFKDLFENLSKGKITPKKYFLQCAALIQPSPKPKTIKTIIAPKKTPKTVTKKTPNETPAKKSPKKTTKKAAKKSAKKTSKVKTKKTPKPVKKPSKESDEDKSGMTKWLESF